jgi:hypothetical protein
MALVDEVKRFWRLKQIVASLHAMLNSVPQW